MTVQVLYCFAFWAVGFFLAVGLVLPFVAVHHAKGFAASASSEIRGI